MNSNMEAKQENGQITHTKMDLDTILIQEVGQFGRFQMRTVALMGIIALFLGWAGSEYLFTTARISTRCLIPECEGTQAAEFEPPWLLNAVPASGNTFDNCRRFQYRYNITVQYEEICPADFFNQDSVLTCPEFVYENSYSIVYDFDLGCDEWRRSLIGSVRIIGTLVALPITGHISDRWGRRVAVTITAFNTAWLGIVRYWTNTYTGFLISQITEATFGGGGFASAHILLMEIVGPKYRVAVGAATTTLFTLGQIALGLLAWAIPYWRPLTLALYIPQLITILYFWIMPESVRWYISKERYDDADKALKNIARVNKKEVSQKSLDLLRETAITDAIERKKLDEKKNSDDRWLIVLVFRHKEILKRVALTPIWWVTMTFVYYGMSINSVNMSGNRYVNFIAVSAVEIPGYWTAVFLLGVIGRKPVLICGYWMSALCQIGYIFLPSNMQGASLAIYLIGKYCISVVVTSLYVYTAELYPTRFRHSLFAFSSMIGRVGSIVAPLTPAFAAAVWDDLPFALFGGMAFIAGLTVFVTPETRNIKLPNTMEEASNVGKKSES